jgi:5-oxoprolinase (ATP-hydrolysing)
MWQFWIDRGGTFTDCLGRGPDGAIRVAKVLSGDRAPLTAIRRILGLGDETPIPPAEIRMGTTVATNALLERKGVATALLITRGFGDLLAIGTQARPDLFALDVVKPEPLTRRIVEIDARLDAEGRAIARPDEAALFEELHDLRNEVESVAVAVLNAYRDDALERSLAALARRAGFSHVVTSRELASEPGLLARADTAVVDGYLTPLLRDYLESLATALPGSRLMLMPSSGDLVEAERFRGPAAVLSGPAGGVVACGKIAEAAGLSEVIGFDMGGTSTDVCRLEHGRPSFAYESETAGVRIRAPMVAVHTVAAGGGSICRFDGQRLRVGPESAGANPGPLCYGREEARELTLGDVGVALGRVQPDRFPFPLDVARVEVALAALAERAGYDDPLRLAAAFFEVANAHMAEAIKQISVARGYDLRRHALLLFGGAAGQHGCALARRLGIQKLLAHPFAGVLSAYGMGLADRGWHGERDLGRVTLDDATLGSAIAALDELEAEGRAVLAIAATVERRIELRYRGTETALAITDAAPDPRAAFEEAHRQRYGYARPDHPIEMVTARIQVRGGAAPFEEPLIAAAEGPPPVLREVPLWFDGFVTAKVFAREDLRAGHHLEGPAIVLEDTGTLVVDPGFTAEVDARGWIVLEARESRARARGERGAGAHVARAVPQPICLDRRADGHACSAAPPCRPTSASGSTSPARSSTLAGAWSPTRPTFPCTSGRWRRRSRPCSPTTPTPAPGDAFVSNDPAGGGSHLPDVTVVTPVHVDGGPPFFVASRGHHADIGGITPGSMPATSRTLAEEGVVLRARLVSGGRLDRRLRSHRAHERPASRARSRSERRGHRGAARRQSRRRRALARRSAAPRPRHRAAYMGHVQDDAAERVAAAIAALPDGERRFADALDDGTTIAVTPRRPGRRMTIDFSEPAARSTGTSTPRAR